MDQSVMLTTVDNPYNPFVQFDLWHSFDIQKGYYTLEYLARIAKTSDELSDADYEASIDDAINEILFFNVLGIYQKVTRESFDSIKSQELSEEQEEALRMLSDDGNVEDETETLKEVDED